jgi:NAD(P)-dependent dehydrogenase (short-subunit alcohol dehydrogenase family)
MSQSGKVVFITNGSSDIGLECIKEFLEIGYYVVYTDVRKIKEESILSNQKVSFHSCDMGDHIQIKIVIDRIIEKFKRIDCVVNIVDVYSSTTSIFDIDFNKYKRLVEMSTSSTISLYRHTFNELKKTNGNMVNVLRSITLMDTDMTNDFIEGKTKMHQLNFVQSLLSETINNGVKINVISHNISNNNKTNSNKVGPKVDFFGGPNEPDKDIAKNIAKLIKIMGESSNVTFNHVSLEKGGLFLQKSKIISRL